MKISIIYYSKTGHTKEMGEEIAAGIRSEGGEARLFSIEEHLDTEYIASSDGVIFGTPTYLASTCWQMKKWFDVDSAGISLAGKLGGVYSTAHFAQGGGDIAPVPVEERQRHRHAGHHGRRVVLLEPANTDRHGLRQGSYGRAQWRPRLNRTPP